MWNNFQFLTSAIDDSNAKLISWYNVYFVVKVRSTRSKLAQCTEHTVRKIRAMSFNMTCLSQKFEEEITSYAKVCPSDEATEEKREAKVVKIDQTSPLYSVTLVCS